MEKEKRKEQYNLLKRPSTLFKYYSFDKTLNVKRFSGEVYLASPLEFNDPCDCQRAVNNNTEILIKNRGEEWMANKLVELGYSSKETVGIMRGLIDNDSDIIDEVHQKQMNKSGILCMTSNYSDAVMWGYYTNNKGYCIEYKVDELIPNLIIGFVNSLDYVTTRYLFSVKAYDDNPVNRAASVDKRLLSLSETMFDESCLDKLSNPYLLEKGTAQSCVYFIRNIFLKRFVAQSIVYRVEPDGSPSDLFFNGDVNRIRSKYFKKTKKWATENEYRLFLSLGGHRVISLGQSVIKNVFLGCNMSDEDAISIAYTMARLSLNDVGIYKMRRLKNGGLQASKLDLSKYYSDFRNIKDILNKT